MMNHGEIQFERQTWLGLKLRTCDGYLYYNRSCPINPNETGLKSCSSQFKMYFFFLIQNVCLFHSQFPNVFFYPIQNVFSSSSQFPNVYSPQTNCTFHLSDDPPARADGRVWEGFLQEELLRVRQRVWNRQRGPWFVSFFRRS